MTSVSRLRQGVLRMKARCRPSVDADKVLGFPGCGKQPASCDVNMPVESLGIRFGSFEGTGLGDP